MIDLTTNKYCNYIISPRSSISKTNFQMTNSIEVINYNYLDELQIDIINVSNNFNILEKKCYFQIISPSLKPIKINIVNELNNNKKLSDFKYTLNLTVNDDIRLFTHYAKYNNKIINSLDLINSQEIKLNALNTDIIKLNFQAKMININSVKSHNYYIIKNSDLKNNNFQIINSIESVEINKIDYNQIKIKNITKKYVNIKKYSNIFKIFSPTFEPFKFNMEFKFKISKI